MRCGAGDFLAEGYNTGVGVFFRGCLSEGDARDIIDGE